MGKLWGVNESVNPQGELYCDHCWTVLGLETHTLKVRDCTVLSVMKYLYLLENHCHCISFCV